MCAFLLKHFKGTCTNILYLKFISCMRKLVIVIGFIFSTSLVSSQDYNGLWNAYVSYNSIVSVSSGSQKIIAASDNAIFTFDLEDEFIRKYSSLDGLSGETISKIHYAESSDIIIIGYANGLIEIIKPDGNVLTVVDIINKSTIPQNKKGINHFTSDGNLIYIATDFGVAVYDISTFQFGDTYFLGNNGSTVTVTQTAIYNNILYASCRDNGGLKYIDLDNPNKIDFNQWQTYTGNYFGVQVVSNKLFTVKSDRIIYELEQTGLIPREPLQSIPIDFRAGFDQLVLTFSNEIQLFDNDLNLIFVETIPTNSNLRFSETLLENQEVFTGTNLEGLMRLDLSAQHDNSFIIPSGPILNQPFKIKATNNELWVSYGAYSETFNPYNPSIDKRGISRLINDEWTNIPYDSLLGAQELNSIAINPSNPDQVFISSLFDGLLELNDTIPKMLHDDSNSSLLPISSTSDQLRIGASSFDNSGVLWVTNVMSNDHLHAYNISSNNWKSYDLSSDVDNLTAGDRGTNELVVDDNGTVWLANNREGVIGVKTVGNFEIVNISGEDTNMPSDIVKSIALDLNNNLWIGTKQGLRVLYNTQGAFDDPNVEVDQIIVEEDGLAQELFFSQFLTAIEVDGSNNKWVGTSDSGVFYVSPDGQQTIYHFTKENSPLPSNSILDISIEKTTGEVFIATENGLVSFISGGTSTQGDLSKVYAYPNPVRPEYDVLGYSNLNNINKGLKLKGLTDNVNIKITDVVGNLVGEAQSNVNYRSSSKNFAIDGGTAIWNGKNLSNNIVATGVYLFLISDLSTFETKTIKVLIVR